MCPVIQRISDQIRNDLRPRLELFIRRRASCDLFFRYAPRTFCAPFVMVAAEPQLREIIEFFVFVDFLGTQMVVIVDNRHLFHMLVIQLFRRIGSEQKIVIHEFFHSFRLMLSMRICGLSREQRRGRPAFLRSIRRSYRQAASSSDPDRKCLCSSAAA